MMTHIYVVWGATGEYSDHQEWPVIAYEDEQLAQEHVTKASERYRELLAQIGNNYKIPDGANEWDPNMRVDYTGTRYYIVTTPVAQVLTQPKGGH
jgi:hypothetical protein